MGNNYLLKLKLVIRKYADAIVHLPKIINLKYIEKDQTIATNNSIIQLKNIQHTILHSHRKMHVRCIFIKFTGGANDIKKYVRELARYYKKLDDSQDITFSAQTAKNLFLAKKSNRLVLCFHLSKHFYEKINGFDNIPNDEAFKRGMRSQETQKILGDGIPDYRWDAKLKQNHTDMMIQLASNEIKDFEPIINKIKEGLTNNNTGKVLKTLNGKVIQGENENEFLEPFGFRDGVTKSPDPIKYALVREPGYEDRHGSFLVFRKLEQNIAQFKQSVSDLADKLEISIEDVEAQIMGRYKDGRPIMFSGTECGKGIVRWFNEDFINYEEIERLNFGKCPFHSHIRKTNPRKADKDIKEAKIVRRGIPYDDRSEDMRKSQKENNEFPKEDVGLLFMCYQRNISTQFEKIQQGFRKDKDFPEKESGIDPIKSTFSADKIPGQIENKWMKKHNKDIPAIFPATVWLTAGEYFYTPSIPYLLELGADKVVT